MLDLESLQAEVERIGKRIEEFAEKVARIDFYIKMAIAVALIFGIGGAWGWKVVSSVKSQVNAVRNQWDEVKTEAEAVKTATETLEKKIPELEKVFHELQIKTAVTNKQSEVIAAEIREKAAEQVGRLFKESRDAGDQLEKNRRDAETAMRAGANTTLADLRQETKDAVDEVKRNRAEGIAEVQRRIQETLSGAIASPVWKNCAIAQVGPQRTHVSKEGPWCPPGTFIVQMNLDAKGLAQQLFVREVLCCAPTFEPPELGAHRN